ncbi:MAG TPA: class I SAM-dependent methyltransferase [Candidatus Sulfotelmatobacter sp.]|nr:class I SAM-dependent methyltransferase [Candidatus Sulfotelmatobacter sp.]
MNRPYHWLAKYYDQLFLPFRSPIDKCREHVLRDILPRVQTACDLACGTGTTAVTLARRGIRVYAVDLSAQMCRLARQKVREANLPVHVLRADMRSFRLPEQVDLVLCEYDAVNHISHKADLLKVARSVHRALRPGGYFFFDVNNAGSFKKYWTGNVWMEKPGLSPSSCAMATRLNSTARGATSKYSVVKENFGSAATRK